MASKLFFVGFFLFSTWVSVVFSGELIPVGAGDAASCLPSLLPCEPYLKSPSPPASCCAPLKEIVSKDPQCLCNVFNNPEMLKSFNVTQDDALKLPKACGADADVSKCKTASSPTSPAIPSGSGPSSNSNSSTLSPPSNGAANGISQFAGFGFISVVVALAFSFL